MPISIPNLALNPNATIDLQMHTTLSDGVWTAEQLITHLAREGFGLAAITDHDRVDTAPELQRLAATHGMALVTAAEISASWRGEPTDVLCYGFAPPANALRAVAEDIARRQTANTHMIVANLHRQGYRLAEDELVTLYAQPSAQQPHALVALLRAHGYGMGEPSAGKLIKEAGFAWMTTDIAVAAEAAHASGAVILVAHPGRGAGYTVFDAALFDELRRGVPIDGFEVYYPAHTPEQIAAYLDYARQHNLLISSGSDSHGPNQPPIHYQAELSRALLERLGARFR